ncbi:uncharacterized protein E0L32_005675 [Thyridium curvatum]|uniref:Uncharacterized protein n=1 Tax=Thyridium curvatum TaxID=1093900 RepID=A0A507AT36_9PEZI|nr:uncharacterized protein E0L32_005675 [Thyridium curvatum]TPX13975.1 hypothetical protein E0L32_005675 [Thyridium curvatum]
MLHLAAETAEAALLQLAPRRAVLVVVGRVHRRAAAAQDLAARLVAKRPQQQQIGEAGEDAHGQDADHDVVAHAVLVRALPGVGRPARVQRVRRRHAAEVAQARDQRRGGRDADLAVPALEDLVGPGHADGHGGAEPEAHHQQAAVAGPGVRQRERDGQQARDLDADGGREEVRPVAVEAVRDGRHDDDGDQVHDPDGRRQQAELDAREGRVDGLDDDGAVELRADAHAHDAKVHQHERPQPPVDQHVAQVAQVPRPRVVHAPHLLVVHGRVLALERLRAGGQPPEPPAARARLPGRQGPVGQPPEQGDAEDDAEQAVDEEHPLEARQALQPVHLLEAGRHEAHDGGRDLRGREVVADALARAGRRVEEGQVVRHAGPHAGDDDAQQEAQELEAPGGLDGGEAHADDADGEDDAGHPDARAEAAHDEVGGEVKEHVRDVEERQGRRGVLGRQVQHRHEVVLDVGVHGLRDADVGPDGRAEEVQHPERRDDAQVELPVDLLDPLVVKVVLRVDAALLLSRQAVACTAAVHLGGMLTVAARRQLLGGSRGHTVTEKQWERVLPVSSGTAARIYV